MDLAYPIRSVVPTLDGPVLAVLARTTRSLSGREIHHLAGIGSVNGVRLALARLVQQGLVRAEDHGAAILYTANREHLAWPAVETLADLRRTFLTRLRNEVQSWQRQPLHASLFGSAARREGGPDSDVDVLLLRPDGLDEEDPTWSEQVDQLRDLVERWTGNRCQPFQLDLDRLAQHVRVRDPLVDEWRRDAVILAGEDFGPVLRRVLTAEQGQAQ